jgi:phytoene dehydrogenase-like protein
MKSVVIIGSGFAGLSAACFMAKAGWKVTVIEKNATPGGRARRLMADGFTFDMGPSFYWMPDVFERFFAQFDKKVSDYYTLQRLDNDSILPIAFTGMMDILIYLPLSMHSKMFSNRWSPVVQRNWRNI